MTLVTWNPWQELNALQSQLDREFVKVPAAELQADEEAIYLRLELPGMEAKDLDIEVTEKAVSITAQRKNQSENQENGAFRTEFHYGKFHRVIPLPARVQNTNVSADYKDGILNLTLPKTEAEKHKVVKVSLGDAA
ncbi:molecular chaperone (small heat shock protein) [Rivularia sp. PCC 7116]|uniref:Hsp20/alpha crystallin family protein n=1 Tax=Rivularia sp. PCC 7116 TaxID=373994 RepID=UPI00029EFC5E|nr:Hsp20/alpha crystallin family protein [Rivularia sp. PCC 7116]AFY56454.1 molecular chaperone (small heat shock protein) [Rivularia sp. PCC 7116]